MILIFQDSTQNQFDWLGSLLAPTLVALFIATISFFFNRKKTRQEINSLKVNTKKSNVEIEKLQLENEQIKRSFQPVVLSTIQAVQDNIIKDKIQGLKLLLKLKAEFLDWEYENLEGDRVLPTTENYFISIYKNYSETKTQEHNKFHQEFAYLFSDKVLSKLNELLYKILDLKEDNYSFYDIHDPTDLPHKESLKLIKEIEELFNESISMVRFECLLDNSFIHEFIETYK